MSKKHWIYPYNPDEIYEEGRRDEREALKEKGYYITPATYIDYSPLIAHLNCQNKRGYIVFIEEV